MFEKILIILYLILFSSLSIAEDLSSIVIKALKIAYNSDHGQYWEYGGIISLYNNKYYISLPHTDHKNDSILIGARSLLPNGYVLEATYHTHPCFPKTKYSEYFSPNDQAMAIYWNVPQFILDACTGKVHEFNPRKIYTTNNLTLSAFNVLISGDIIGNIEQKSPPMD